MQVLLGVLQRGCDLHGRLASVPQLDGQPHQQALAQADIGAVHKQHVVHVGQVCRKLSALASAGKLMGKKDADDLVACGRCLSEEALKQLRAGLAGGGQLLAGGQLLSRPSRKTVPSSSVTLRGMTVTPSCAASAGRISDAESVRMRIIKYLHGRKPPGTVVKQQKQVKSR